MTSLTPSTIDQVVLDFEQLSNELIGQTPVNARFRDHLIGYLKEAYGVEKSPLTPDIKCFVNAQANTYSQQGQSEINNICGAIQLAPGRTGKKDGKRVTVEKVPDCVNVNFAQSELLYDSCAFTDVLTGDRITPEAALKRQLDTLQGFPAIPPEVWLVSYDRLIDEKHVMGERIKERWSVEQGEDAVIQTVEAAQYLNSQRQNLDGYKLVMSCQGVNADQYQRCVEQVLEVCRPDDVLGLGGWCILGKQKRWLPVFWEVCDRVIPIIAQSGIQHVHIFGCTWYKPMQGFPVSPLIRLLEACDKHGLSLSVDGRSPISNALWKNWKQAGATFPYWRHNLAWVKAELATLKDSITSSTCNTIIPIGWGIAAEEELNRIQGQIDNCCLEQDEVQDLELKKALFSGYEAAQEEFTDAVLRFSNEAAALGYHFSFQSLPQPEDGQYNRIKVYVQPVPVCSAPPFALLPKPQPKEDAPVVDFWCGGGGVGTAGFLQAGFQIGVNIDCDPKNLKLSNAIADCYELNFSKPVVRKTLQEYARRGGFKTQQRPDVVIFTQSCKHLSRANPGAEEDETDIEVAIAATQGLEELLPQVFVLENVRDYKDSRCLEIIKTALDRLGYRYVYNIENSWEYGVAQSRERFILVAVRGEVLPTLPAPVVTEPYGWKWACADLVDTFPITQPAPWQLKSLSELGSDGRFANRQGRRLISGANSTNRGADEPSFVLTASQSANRMRIYLVERTGAREGTPQIRESNHPSWTVKASIFTDGKGANRQDGLNTWDGKGEWRSVTNRGVARLMGLYDWYQLPEKPSVFGPLLGNGLPSEMARAIAEHIKFYLSEENIMAQTFSASTTPVLQENVKDDTALSGYPKEEWLNPDAIVLDCATQSRPYEFSQEKLDDYIADMKSGDWDMERRPLPEVCLAPDGRYYAVDCHHRAKAAVWSLHPGRNMLFLVRKGTLSQARLWSAAANTMHGLGADNSPQGVRKRIEMFLDNIQELSPEEYNQEFLKVPDLTPREKAGGIFTNRLIARYLRLRENQYKTVGNIIKERELAGKISQFEIGDRIEVFFPADIENDKHPKGFEEGDAGTIEDKDKKVGLWVKWDKCLNQAPFPIHPDFVKSSDKPKPQPKPVVVPRPAAPPPQTAPIPATEHLPTEGTRVEITNPDSIYAGRFGTITSFPSAGFAIVAIEATENQPPGRVRVAVSDMQARPVKPPPVKAELDLVDLLKTVVDNLHLLRPEELEALEGAIAQAKQRWTQAA